jgi:hypothetical protein
VDDGALDQDVVVCLAGLGGDFPRLPVKHDHAPRRRIIGLVVVHDANAGPELPEGAMRQGSRGAAVAIPALARETMREHEARHDRAATIAHGR